MATNFPAQLDTNANLNVASDLLSVAVLTANISETTKSLPVDSTEGYPIAYGILLIGSEQITYTSVTDKSFENCTRGYNSTQPVAHKLGAPVTTPFVASYHNNLKDAVLQIQSVLGVNAGNVAITNRNNTFSGTQAVGGLTIQNGTDFWNFNTSVDGGNNSTLRISHGGTGINPSLDITGITLSSVNASQIQGKAVDAPTTTGTQLVYNGTKYINQSKPYIDARDYGLVGDGTTDNTAAFNTLIAAMCAGGDREIYFKPGQYRFASKPNAIGCGIWLKGAANGSNQNYGTALIADYNEATPTNGFLTWDGSLSPGFAGTGGGIKNLSIYKNVGKSGGTAIKFTGSDDNHRAGWMSIHNVLVTSISSALWNKGLIIDGSCCTTSGGQGVRDWDIRGFYPANMMDGDSAVYFNNSTNLFWNGGEVITAAGSPAGITVTGNGSGTQAATNVFLSNVYTTGNVVFDYANNVQFVGGTIGGNFTSTANTTTPCYVLADIEGTGGTGGVTTNGTCRVQNHNSNASHWDIWGNPIYRNSIGIGSTAAASAALYISTALTTGTSQWGIDVNSILAGTNESTGIVSIPQIANSVTATKASAFRAANFGLGTGSAITTQIAFECSTLSSGGTNYCFKGDNSSIDQAGKAAFTGITIASTAFASLGTPANGTVYYCSDCTIANPCASGGSGAIAKRLNGVWVCN